MINLKTDEESKLPIRAAKRFYSGQLISHKNYHYRGVIVDSDPSFSGPEQWYLTNQTQPDKDQPWYHVLVDESMNVTYAAQSNLLVDHSEEPVAHPLVPIYFSGFAHGHYVRNEIPWES